VAHRIPLLHSQHTLLHSGAVAASGRLEEQYTTVAPPIPAVTAALDVADASAAAPPGGGKLYRALGDSLAALVPVVPGGVAGGIAAWVLDGPLAVLKVILSLRVLLVQTFLMGLETYILPMFTFN
jgi:hypothetical protein